MVCIDSKIKTVTNTLNLSKRESLKAEDLELRQTEDMTNLLVETNPRSQMKRFKEEEELSIEEQDFIKKYETPDSRFQNELAVKLGSDFSNLVKQFDEDGVLILPNYFSGAQLKEMQEFFQSQMKLKPLDKFLKQASFNGAVDQTASLSKSKGMSKALADPTMAAVISHYLGQPATFANWRGYRLGKRDPLLYRAWDWHNDQKRKEVKVMILLNDVPEDGQAMHVIPGSQKKWWNMETQNDSKYSLDEALSFGAEGKAKIKKCHGKAGTVIFFDTNIVHRGHRNQSESRDVLTFNFLVDKEGAAIFPLKPLHQDVVQEHKDDFIGNVLRMSDTQGSNNKKDLFKQTVNPQTIQEKLSSQIVITTEQDISPEEISQLRNAYHSTPTYANVKLRFQGGNIEDFKNFLTENVQVDLATDLDLPIRMGGEDVDRDIQFVVYRDSGSNSPFVRQLKENVTQLDFSSLTQSRQLSIQNFIDATKYLQTICKDTEETTLKRIGKLASDLECAFGYADSVERIRSNLIYTYAMLIDSKNELPNYEVQLNAMAQDILLDYAYIVLNDDLAQVN